MTVYEKKIIVKRTIIVITKIIITVMILKTLIINMATMDDQWWSSRIVSVRSNRVLNKR